MSCSADQARARRRARVGAAVLESFALDSMGFCAQGSGCSGCSIRPAKHGLCPSAHADQARARRRARVGAAVLESFALDSMGFCAQGRCRGRHGCSIRQAKHGLCLSVRADQARAWRRARVGAAVLESFVLDCMGFCAQGRCRGRSGRSIRPAKHGLCLSARVDLMGQSHGIWSPSCSSS